MDFVKLIDTKLSVEEICGLVSNPTCGAVSLFVGMTKENFEDKKVIHLEYEAYEPMAVKSIKKICEDIRSKWKVEHIAIYHRMGVVPVLEASVVIAISSVHRSESLQAVQYAIDSLKASVPIWKKEVYETSPPVWKENQESHPGHLLTEHSYDVPESKFFSYIMEEASVPPHLIQVKASTDEINHRIEMFIKRKRETINLTNIRDFCQGVKEGTCARVNAVLVPRKGSKSHLKVRKVLNKWGPQTRGLDPGSIDQMDSETKEDPTPESHSGGAAVSYPGIEGRIAYAEKYLNISNKPVPKDIYARLKQIEDKILYLQSVSPEYSSWGQPLTGPEEKDLVKLRKKKHTPMELTSKIEELERRLTENDVQ
ncbi:molybdopterin synthase catalytic subunit [Ischnura elegans]|uniref:molybdopterin synthase catalytic subunit n=1 Tax=Ischnura elegans TaxID=197161 RepID=UPI001ED89E11|nr:molybdopterin synthase catalytic subunit [Ischnura elegans]